MPRKFLGERISSNVDAIRPASMVLTDEMLQCIPRYNFTELDNCEQELDHSPYVGTRLSRKYGGTLYLKKRLQSVPALFMQEHRRLRLDRQGQSRVQPMPLEQHHGISNSTQREMDKNEPVMSQGAATHKTWEGIPRQQQYILSRGQHTGIDQSRFTPRSVSEFEKFYNSNSCTPTNDLFEEIISIYCDESNAADNSGVPSKTDVLESPEPVALQDRSEMLYREVEIMMDRIQKQQNIFEMNRRLSNYDTNHPGGNDNFNDSTSSLESTPSRTQLNKLCDLHSLSGSPVQSHSVSPLQHNREPLQVTPARTPTSHHKNTHTNKYSNASSSTDDASYRTAHDTIPTTDTSKPPHGIIANMEHLGIEMRTAKRATIDPPKVMFLDSDAASEIAPLDPYRSDREQTPYSEPGDTMLLQLEKKIDQISIDDASLNDQSSSVYS